MHGRVQAFVQQGDTEPLSILNIYIYISAVTKNITNQSHIILKLIPINPT